MGFVVGKGIYIPGNVHSQRLALNCKLLLPSVCLPQVIQILNHHENLPLDKFKG